AERIDNRRPFETVDRPRPVARAGGIDLVDRHDLALLAGQEVVVVIAPVGGGVAAKRETLEFRIGRGPRRHVEDAYFEHVAGLRAAHENRAGADMDAEPLAVAFARPAAE